MRPGVLRRRVTAFTLIEVMVVVLVIGIIVTFATISLGTNEQKILEDEAKRIVALTELAREEAILDGQEMALTFAGNGYRFEIYDGEQWLAAEGDDVLRPRALPENVELQVALLGEALTLVSRAQSSEASGDGANPEQKKEEEDVVRIFLLSTGEMTPFEAALSFEGQDGGFKLAANALGQFEVQAVSD